MRIVKTSKGRDKKESKMARKNTNTRQKNPTNKKSLILVNKKNKKNAAPRTSKQYFALPEAQQETWNRVVHVIAKMRSEKISLTKASREFDLNPKVVQARAGAALRKTKNGRYVAKPSDKLLRVLVIPIPEGSKEVAVRGSAVASKIGEYHDAVKKFSRTGDSSSLKKFKRLKLLDEKGKRIKLLTDLDALRKLGSAGVLRFEDIYRRAA